MGIRTAARKKKSRPPRMPIATLVVRETARTIKELYPKIEKLYLVGSRLRHREARDLDFVAASKVEEVNGRNVTLRVGNMSVNLFFALSGEEEPTLLEFGLGLDIIRWKRQAIKLGFHLNRYGLWKGKALVSQKMVEIAQLIHMPLKSHLLFTLHHPF